MPRGPPGRPENVWICWQQGRGTKWEALASLDHEPGVLDCTGGVARQMTAARNMRPKGRIGELLKARLPRRVCDDVVIETQFPARPNDAVELRQRGGLIGHRAKHERGNAGSKGPRRAGKTLSTPLQNGDGNRSVSCRALSALSQIRAPAPRR